MELLSISLLTGEGDDIKGIGLDCALICLLWWSKNGCLLNGERSDIGLWLPDLENMFSCPFWFSNGDILGGNIPLPEFDTLWFNGEFVFPWACLTVIDLPYNVIPFNRLMVKGTETTSDKLTKPKVLFLPVSLSLGIWTAFKGAA